MGRMASVQAGNGDGEGDNLQEHALPMLYLAWPQYAPSGIDRILSSATRYVCSHSWTGVTLNTMKFLLDPPIKRVTHLNGFKSPPLDGSLTISELYDFHYENNSSHPVFLYQATNGQLSRLTFSEVVPAAHAAARVVARRAHLDLGGERHGSRPTIAILASTGRVISFHLLSNC